MKSAVFAGTKLRSGVVFASASKPEEYSNQEEKPPDTNGDGKYPPSQNNLVILTHTENPVREFFNVEDEVWNDWKWQWQNLIRKPEQLTEIVGKFMTPDERRAAVITHKEFKILISPYYLSLIRWDDLNDPVRKMIIPSIEEIEDNIGEIDPLDEEEDMPVPGLTHRYPDRVLLFTTNMCAGFCRFCTRKRILGQGDTIPTYKYFDKIIEYLREHPRVRDIVLSGGDPLVLPLRILEKLLSDLSKIPNIEVIRIGTRVPVMLPMKLFDPRVISILEKYSEKLWINTHFNCKNEITPEAKKSVLNLLKIGIPVNNQSVLLKGVNDSVEIQRELLRKLMEIKVRPYYLYHCDPTKGVSHFRTTVWKGMEIMEGLRGHISGLAVPVYVVDAPGGGGKIPLMPNYLVSASDKTIVLRNYEGSLFSYNPKGDPIEHEKTREHFTGVISLIKGMKKNLVPYGTERYERRRLKIQKPKYTNGNGNEVKIMDLFHRD